MLAALTGQRFGKSVSKYRIQNSKCFQVILQFLEPSKILTFQTLSRRLYNEHVPAVLFTMRLTTSSFLNSIQMFVMRSLFSEEAKLNLLYTGSRHEFSAHVFHQICDNQGPTISICLSEHDHIFGFFTTEPWNQEGGLKEVEGPNFLFRILDNNQLRRFNQIKVKVWHDREVLIGNSYYFWIKDRANVNQVNRGEIFKSNHKCTDEAFYD